MASVTALTPSEKQTMGHLQDDTNKNTAHKYTQLHTMLRYYILQNRFVYKYLSLTLMPTQTNTHFHPQINILVRAAFQTPQVETALCS